MLGGWSLCFDSVVVGLRHCFDSVVDGVMHKEGQSKAKQSKAKRSRAKQSEAEQSKGKQRRGEHSKANKKQSKAKQSRAKEKRKAKHDENSFKMSSKSSKIVIKSRSRGGLGRSWGLFLLQISLSWASWGALGSIWHQKPEKKEKNTTFLGVFGPSWEAFWRPCGLQEAILAASWASWAR